MAFRPALPALALLLATPLGAQAPASAIAASGARPGCVDSMPASALTPVPVFVVPTLRDTSQRFFLPQLGTIAQDLANRGRAMLGATGDSLPHGEPLVTWRGVHRALRVTWNRDGSARWRPEPDSTRGDAAPPAPGTVEAESLLARALETARAEGSTVLFWPDAPAPDSVVFDLGFQSPLVDDTNGVHPIRAAVAVPMMVVEAPRVRPVRVIRMRPPSYPTAPLTGSATGTVVLQFVVDTAGRADMSTLRDLWPADRPRLRGQLGRFYDDFVRSARSAVEKATFDPARIGGCKVRQAVQEPFTYTFP